MRRPSALLILALLPWAMAASPRPAPKPAAKPAAKPAPRPADWTTRVTTSPIGGHIMGNPAAPTKLVEYISYTCIHCARLTTEGGEELKQGWVRGGAVSVEIRNLVRDPFDMTAALLARCGGPGKFFGNHAALFDNYDNWMSSLRHYEAVAPTMAGKPREQIFAAVADKTGLFALMQKRGFTRPQLVACLNDKAATAQVLAMTTEATDKVMVTGTPGIVINGTLLEGTSWDFLKSALPPAKS